MDEVQIPVILSMATMFRPIRYQILQSAYVMYKPQRGASIGIPENSLQNWRELYFTLVLPSHIVSTYTKKCCDRETVTDYVLYGLCHLGYSIVTIHKQHLSSTCQKTVYLYLILDTALIN
jgi:hypothetical protein